MKVLVLSDSHGCMDSMEQAVEKESPDMIIHLGDRARDAQKLSEEFWRIPMLSVPGNCDFSIPGEAETLLREISGVRVLITHGHRYGVKTDLRRLQETSRESGAEVVLFGHTHCQFCAKIDNMLFLNPGSCFHFEKYGILLVENGRPECYTI